MCLEKLCTSFSISKRQSIEWPSSPLSVTAWDKTIFCSILLQILHGFLTNIIDLPQCPRTNRFTLETVIKVLMLPFFQHYRFFHHPCCMGMRTPLRKSCLTCFGNSCMFNLWRVKSSSEISLTCLTATPHIAWCIRWIFPLPCTHGPCSMGQPNGQRSFIFSLSLSNEPACFDETSSRTDRPAPSTPRKRVVHPRKQT